MNRQQAQAEQDQCLRHSQGALRRAVRLESQGHELAADSAWRNMLYWKAQATRENLLFALSHH